MHINTAGEHTASNMLIRFGLDAHRLDSTIINSHKEHTCFSEVLQSWLHSTQSPMKEQEIINMLYNFII